MKLPGVLLLAAGLLLPCAVSAQYYQVNSSAGVAAAYPWVDISATGTTLALADDANSGLINLGFTFNYAGTNFTQLRIASNGNLQFGTNVTTFANTNFAVAFSQSMLPFWDDLHPGGVATRIRYQTLGTAPSRRFVVSWLAVPHYCSGGAGCAANQTAATYTFQVQIYENGNFVYRYQAMGTSGGNWTNGTYTDAGATVGYQFAANDWARFSFNTNSVPAGTTILFYRLDHYQVSHGGSGLNCAASDVVITAHNPSHALVIPTSATTMSLATAFVSGSGGPGGRGDWSAVTAAGTLANGAADDGAASYTWSGGETGITLGLRISWNQAANINLSSTVGAAPNGGTRAATERSGTAAADIPFDQNITFAPAGFRFVDAGNNNLPNQVAGVTSATLNLQAISSTGCTTPGACTGACTASPFFANGTNVAVDLAYECANPVTCQAGQTLTFTNNGSTAIAGNPAGAPSSYTNKTLTWGANATAAFTLNYTDVGQLRLYARYAVPPAATLMTGSSAAFVVRPFGFTIANVRRTSDSFANPAAADATGTGFIGAGRSFTLSVTAVNQTGNPTPNYGKETAPEGVLLTPALVAGLGLTAIPALGNNVVAGAEFGAGGAVADANGTATVTNVNWGEAGIITITPSVGDGDYLGAGDVTGTTTGNVGRFFPDHYALTGVPALTNRSALLCAPASTFTYMGEGLVLAFSLQAQNAANAVTQNYRTSGTASQNFAKLDLGALASLNSGARSGATNLTPRIDATGGTSAGTWSNGAANVTATTGIRRATPDAPDGPYAATAFGIAPADVDGVAMNTLDLDVDNNSVNDHKALGVATEFRFGRLRLLNAYGSGATVLPVPIEVQYWNGTSFALNSADSCTSLPRSAIALGFTAPLVACNTAVSSATVAFAAGVGSLVLSAPGAGNSGSVLLTPNLGTAAGSYCNPGSFVAATASPANYLLGRWDDAANPDTDGNTAYDDKPGARAAFGVYGSQPRNFIFFRENY